MILLTREINEVLASHGLDMLTIARADNGYVELVGKACKMPIMTLGHIVVGNKLTKLERDIIKDDYLCPAIIKYSKELHAVIAAHGDKKATEDIQEFIDLHEKDLSVSITSNHMSANENDYGYISKKVSFSLKSKSDFDANSMVTYSYSLTRISTSINIKENCAKEAIKLVKNTAIVAEKIEQESKRVEQDMKTRDQQLIAATKVLELLNA